MRNLRQKFLNKKAVIYTALPLATAIQMAQANNMSNQVQDSQSGIFSNVFSGGESLISRNNYNGRALDLLQWRKRQNLKSPYFVLGGSLEERVTYGHDAGDIFKSAGNSAYVANGNSSGFYLRTARIDAMAAVNNDLTLETGYDMNVNHIRTLSAIIGNLQNSPWYGQVGKFYPNLGFFLPIDIYNYNLVKFYFRPDPTLGGGITYYKNGLRFSFTEFTQQGQDKLNDGAVEIEKDISSGLFKERISIGAMYNWVGTTIDAKRTLGNYDVSPAIYMGTIAIYDRGIFSVTFGQVFKGMVFNAYNVELGYMFGNRKSFMVMLGYSQTNGLDKYPNITINMQNHNNLYNQVLLGARELWSKHISFGGQVADVKSYSSTHMQDYIYANLDIMFKF